MGRKKWRVAAYNKELVSAIAADNGIDVFAALLLACRGITQDETIQEFCFGNAELCDPFELPDMDIAVDAIMYAFSAGEKMAVYGDYDADGVTATALLSGYLKSQGANVVTYIPDRNSEGYGINKEAVDKLCADGVKLIITVDNGISACEEAEYIAKLGMKLVITDHHKAGEVLPNALAVVDPQRADCECEFTQWAGVGVAFKLVCALEGDDGHGLLNQYAQLVTIGTIADVVPLNGENRTIVKRGLELINTKPITGITEMLKVAGASGKKLNASSVAFSIVPRINAMGRMGSVDSAFDLLAGNGDSEECAKQLDENNVLRQQTENDIIRQALDMIAENPAPVLERIIVISGEGWHAGVIGIVASRISEKYGKPCIIIAVDGENAKGSGRSIAGFSLYDAMCYASDLLTHYGGHTLAVGFAIASSKIDEFRRLINEYARGIDMPFASIDIDCRLRPESLSIGLIDAFELLEPFGAGNPQPLFGLFGMTLSAIQPVGNGKHLRLTLTKNGHSITAMLFSVTVQKFQYEVSDVIDLAVRLDKNEYRSQVNLSVHIKAIRPSGSDDDAYLNGIRLFERILLGEEVSKAEAARAYADRSFIAKVFRIIRDSGGKTGDCEVICMRLGDDADSCKVMVAIEALCELGIIVKDDGGFILPELDKKANLESAEILLKINGLK